MPSIYFSFFSISLKRRVVRAIGSSDWVHLKLKPKFHCKNLLGNPFIQPGSSRNPEIIIDSKQKFEFRAVECRVYGGWSAGRQHQLNYDPITNNRVRSPLERFPVISGTERWYDSKEPKFSDDSQQNTKIQNKDYFFENSN